MDPESKLQFQLNEEVFYFDMECMESCDAKLMQENNQYAIKYIINLMNNGTIILQEPLKIIYRIRNNEHIIIYKADKEEFQSQFQSELEEVEEDATVGEKKRSEWGEQDTEILLEKYEIYMKMVGPMKKFKNEKVMWEKIATDIEDNIGRKYTSVQVENRFKTLLKRKKDAIEHNKRSGNERTDVPYEEQLEKIASLDDSIKPEILMSIHNTRILKNHNASSSLQSSPLPKKIKMMPENKIVAPSLKSNNGEEICFSKGVKMMRLENKIVAVSLKRSNEKEIKENKKKSIQETLLELHRSKEESKERRHQEKLQLIKELFKKDM